jgi:hypothetical protein
MHFGPDFADFRVLGIRHPLDQIVDPLEKLLELRTDGALGAPDIISRGRRREWGA